MRFPSQKCEAMHESSMATPELPPVSSTQLLPHRVESVCQHRFHRIRLSVSTNKSLQGAVQRNLSLPTWWVFPLPLAEELIPASQLCLSQKPSGRILNQHIPTYRVMSQLKCIETDHCGSRSTEGRSTLRCGSFGVHGATRERIHCRRRLCGAGMGLIALPTLAV